MTWRSAAASLSLHATQRPYQMKWIICTTCNERAVEIPQRAQANSRVICRHCGAVHTLSTLVKALDEGHERNKSGDNQQK